MEKVKVYADLETVRPRSVKVKEGKGGHIELKSFGRSVFIQGVDGVSCELVSFTGKKSKLKDRALPKILIETDYEFAEGDDGVKYIGGKNIMIIGDDPMKPVAVAVFDLFMPNGVKTTKPLLEIIEYVDQPEKDDE